MHLRTKGIIIKEQTVKESDRLVTLLTADYGILRAFVRGAKKLNSRMSGASLFTYGEFEIYQTKNAYIVDSFESIEHFFALRNDIVRLSLAQYFAQLMLNFADENCECTEYLRLMTNSLFLMCKGDDNYKKIKAAFELRTMMLSGYMPNLLGCDNCGAYEDETMFFDIRSGLFYCSQCCKNAAIPLSKGIFTAMRYICLSDVKRVFSFTLSDESMDVLAQVAEQYLLEHTDSQLGTLSFYKSLV